VTKLSIRRQVGRTPLSLPVFGFGSAHLGELYSKVDEAESRATLEAAWNSGVRFYDTAPWYGRGLSEHRLGGFLRTRPRDEFLITTKVGRTLVRPKNPKIFDRAPWLGGLNFEVEFDYTYDGIMRSYAQALQRLALDTVDALVIHDLDVGYQGEHLAQRRKDLANSGIKALDELKTSGDIQAYGMGINTNEALATVATDVDLDFVLVAMPYTLPRPGEPPCRHGRLPEARHRRHHRRAVCFGHPGDGFRRQLQIWLWRRSARSAGQGPRHRGRLPGA